MKRILFCSALGLACLNGTLNAGDFPFEPIVLSDGVLLINKGNGQSWIMESGAPRPPGMQRNWSQLQLPGWNTHPTDPRTPQSPNGQPMHGGPAPGVPGFPNTGFPGHDPNAQRGFHSGFGPMMSPQMTPHQTTPPPAMHPPQFMPPQFGQQWPTPPPGSYSQNVPVVRWSPLPVAPPLPAENSAGSAVGDGANTLPVVNPPAMAAEPITSTEPLPPPGEVPLPEPTLAEPTSPELIKPEPAISSEQKLAPEVQSADELKVSSGERRSGRSKDRTDREDGKAKSDHGQPLIMVVASDSEIDLDEVLMLRLSAIASKANDAVQAKITVDFPADGKLVRGGNPSSISDDKGDVNHVSMNHSGNKPLDLVFRFTRPGKKSITVAVDAVGKKATTSFSINVEDDDDDDKSSKDKKSSSSSSQKKDSHKKK